MVEHSVRANVMQLPLEACRHHHRHHQLVVGLRGHAEIDVEGLGARLDSTHACIVPTDARHDYFGNQRNHVLVINLDRECPLTCDPLHPEYNSLAPLFEKPRLVVIDKQLQMLVQACSREMSADQQPDSLKRHFAAGIMHCLSLRLDRKGLRRVRSHALDLGTIDRFLETHMHEKLSVADLAAVACLSVSHFHELFRGITGMSPHQYVIEARLKRARHLLLETRLSLAEISLQVGFSSQSALTSAFRRHHQVTPAHLRACQG